jgi:hypothetical protein
LGGRNTAAIIPTRYVRLRSLGSRCTRAAARRCCESCQETGCHARGISANGSSTLRRDFDEAVRLALEGRSAGGAPRESAPAPESAAEPHRAATFPPRAARSASPSAQDFIWSTTISCSRWRAAASLAWTSASVGWSEFRPRYTEGGDGSRATGEELELPGYRCRLVEFD